MGYNATEAARLVSWANKQSGGEGISKERLENWIDAGVALLSWDDVWEGEKFIDFPTLISLWLICRLHSHGVPLESITDAVPQLRQGLGVKWPFASKAMWNLPETLTLFDRTEAIDIVVKGLLIWRLSQGWVPPGLEFDEDGTVSAWLPVPDVVIDPSVVSGSPCVIGTRTPTWIFPGMLENGDSVEELADGYRLAKERVLNAVEWERQLAVAGV